MRIAYFTNTYPRATDTFIRGEVAGLRHKGFDVKTYSVRKIDHTHDVDESVIEEKRNTQYLLPVAKVGLLINLIRRLVKNPVKFAQAILLAAKTSKPGMIGSLLQLAYFLEAVQLSGLLEKDGIEHIHNHFGDSSGTVTMLASSLTGMPYSFSVHGPHIFFDELNWGLEEKTRNAKFVTCIGHYCKSKMMLNTKADIWNRFHIVRCGIDLDTFIFRKPKNQVNRLIFLGRLSPEKGVQVLIDSLVLLREDGYFPSLLIMGDGEEKLDLENYISHHKLNNSVEFTGFVDQKRIIQELEAGDILVLPSFAEGIPVVLMEAMAIGVPVIGTYVGGIVELVTPGETGQLVSPSDSEGLAKAISRYMDDSEFAGRLAVNGRSRVEEKFNAVDQIDKLASLFRSG